MQSRSTLPVVRAAASRTGCGSAGGRYGASLSRSPEPDNRLSDASSRIDADARITTRNLSGPFDERHRGTYSRTHRSECDVRGRARRDAVGVGFIGRAAATQAPVTVEDAALQGRDGHRVEALDEGSHRAGVGVARPLCRPLSPRRTVGADFSVGRRGPIPPTRGRSAQSGPRLLPWLRSRRWSSSSATSGTTIDLMGLNQHASAVRR